MAKQEDASPEEGGRWALLILAGFFCCFIGFLFFISKSVKAMDHSAVESAGAVSVAAGPCSDDFAGTIVVDGNLDAAGMPGHINISGGNLHVAATGYFAEPRTIFSSPEEDEIFFVDYANEEFLEVNLPKCTPVQSMADMDLVYVYLYGDFFVEGDLSMENVMLFVYGDYTVSGDVVLKRSAVFHGENVLDIHLHFNVLRDMHREYLRSAYAVPF